MAKGFPDYFGTGRPQKDVVLSGPQLKDLWKNDYCIISWAWKRNEFLARTCTGTKFKNPKSRIQRLEIGPWRVWRVSMKEGRFKLRFVAWDEYSRDLVASCGKMPALDLALPRTKTWLNVMDHLSNKWLDADNLLAYLLTYSLACFFTGHELTI